MQTQASEWYQQGTQLFCRWCVKSAAHQRVYQNNAAFLPDRPDEETFSLADPVGSFMCERFFLEAIAKNMKCVRDAQQHQSLVGCESFPQEPISGFEYDSAVIEIDANHYSTWAMLAEGYPPWACTFALAALH
jgi:hypothetical protein